MKNRKPKKGAKPNNQIEDSPVVATPDEPNTDTIEASQIDAALSANKSELEIKREEISRLREELQESRDKNLVLYDFAPAGYITLDREGIIVEANLTLAEMLGCSKRDLIGYQINRYVMADSQNILTSHLALVLETGIRRFCELNLKKRDGSTVFARADSVAIRDTRGYLSQCLTTIIDLTFYRRQDNTIRDRLFGEEVALDVIIATDKDLNIIRWDKGAETMFGWQADEVLGQQTSSRDRVLAFLNDDRVVGSIVEKSSWAGKAIVTRKDGLQLITEVSAGILWDNDGTFNGVVAEFCRSNVSEKEKVILAIDDIEAKTPQKPSPSIVTLHRTIKEIVQAMAYIAGVRDPYTAGHQRRVAQLSFDIARFMGLHNEQGEGLTIAAFVHDIGKIHIPENILNKPGKLTRPEFNMLKEHTQIGYDILKNIEFPWPIAKIVLQHHERMNGSGYPSGIAGDQIIIEARILAVADVVEAMSSDRPYRAALSLEEAFSEINNNKGILYDPQVVDVCMKVFNNKGFSVN